ncbi:MAG: endonuclease/exonuclease/phosphatase family protein [Rhodobacteraceae bacterium]|nr:endonuclease/exonuclease/phosphatase family protein [Paracoccaceae bacterium]
MRIATLNVQNLRLLKSGGARSLHGAWDSDDPETTSHDPVDRQLTAELLCEIDADVVALQEVYDLETLDYFHDACLLPAGLKPYRHRICVPGNDGRGLDVALLSRRGIDAVRSHAALTPAQLDLAPPKGTDPDLPVFRRDCLMASVGALTLFVCHFKSAYPDPEVAWLTRHLEAMATRRIIEQHFEAPREALWLVLGDLNEPGAEGEMDHRAIRPLEEEFSVDLMQRVPPSDRWTYFDTHSSKYHCPDALLASPALARRWPEAKPVVVRGGLETDAARFRGPHFTRVGKHRPHASDHAAVRIDLQGL